MRNLATIRIIEDVQPIENADVIEKVRIDGWWVVSKKGEFKTGDKCVYFEIDSLLPTKEPFTFLEKAGRKKTLVDGKECEGYRLKTIKLRGQISQGLALPLNQFPEISQTVGDDVSDFIGVVKYEPPIPIYMSGEVLGSFPGFIPKTDEERIQNCPDILERYHTSRFYITEKIDGTSATFYKYDGNFGVCSRNLRLKENENNLFWKIANRYNLKEILPEGFALQAEVIGEGINKNPLKQRGQDCFVFYVININTQEYLLWHEIEIFVKNIGMKTVPLLNDNFYPEASTFDTILKMADRKSLLNPNEDAEGLIFRLYQSAEKISFKAISNKYLLNHE